MPTTGLPPFRADAICPKCGAPDPWVAWHNRERAGEPCWCKLPYGVTEHFCRGCRRCGYKWQEAVPKESSASALRIEGGRTIMLTREEVRLLKDIVAYWLDTTRGTRVQEMWVAEVERLHDLVNG